jgi:hypothetical protein
LVYYPQKKILFESLMVLGFTLLFKGIYDKVALMHEPEMLRAMANINTEFYWNMVMSENAAFSDFASIS